MKIERALRKFPNFAHFSDEELELLVNSAELRRYGEGEVIVRAGAPADELFILLEGSADLEVHEQGRTRYIGHEGSGALFGLNGLLRGGVRGSDVVASGAVKVLVLNRYAFDILYGRSIHFCLLVSRQLVDDARRVNEAISATLAGGAEDAERLRHGHASVKSAVDALFDA